MRRKTQQATPRVDAFIAASGIPPEGAAPDALIQYYEERHRRLLALARELERKYLAMGGQHEAQHAPQVSAEVVRVHNQLTAFARSEGFLTIDKWARQQRGAVAPHPTARETSA